MYGLVWNLLAKKDGLDPEIFWLSLILSVHIDLLFSQRDTISART